MPGKSRILLIEDSADDALIARRALLKAGFQGELVHMEDPRRALAYLNGDGEFANRTRFALPQAILLDLKMPGMHGFEVLKWIKAQPQLNRILIIVLTRIEELKLITEAYQLGAHSFLSKDANAEEVQNMVRFIRDYAALTSLPDRCSGGTE